jgi:predicted enzyme related to lactoylglutathione lyase
VDLDAIERPSLGVALWFRTTDAQVLHDRLAAAGVRIVRPPENGPFGTTFTFVGPEGYAITTHGA